MLVIKQASLENGVEPLEYSLLDCTTLHYAMYFELHTCNRVMHIVNAFIFDKFGAVA